MKEVIFATMIGVAGCGSDGDKKVADAQVVVDATAVDATVVTVDAPAVTADAPVVTTDATAQTD